MTSILKSGDLIGIAAPSSPFKKELFLKGIEVVKKMGFEIFYCDDIFSSERYLAGDDTRRAKELHELFTNKKIKAILFARGGYGSQKIIPLLNLELIKKNRKRVVGFSDLTALLTFLRQKAELPTAYGPSITHLGKHNDPQTLNSLKQCLFSSATAPIDLEKCSVMKQGKAKGILVGGCLSLLATSMGTPYELKTDGNILFFEDTDEKVYAIDRMLTQFKNAGKLKRVKGILIGSLAPKEGEPHSMSEMLQKVLADFQGPIVAGLQTGHTHPFVTLPLGVSVTIDTKQRELIFDPSH